MHICSSAVMRLIYPLQIKRLELKLELEIKNIIQALCVVYLYILFMIVLPLWDTVSHITPLPPITATSP